MNEFKQHAFAINSGNAINTFVLPFVFSDKVKEAVESIWKCFDPAEHRLILIDNSSEDFKDKKWLEDNSHLYIRAYRNLGPAMAFNLGIQMARTEFVTCFSDDARMINSFWFERAVARIEAEEEKQKLVEIYSPLIISANSIHPQDTEQFYDSQKGYSEGDYNQLCKQYESFGNGFSLACATGRGSAWLDAGLFDEEAYVYWIDGKFAFRANRIGVLTQYSGVVFHYGDSSHKGRLVEEGKYQDTGKLKEGRLVL